MATINVNSGGNLQTAINSAALGDEIVLEADADFTGNFELKDKGAGSSFITIKSSAADSLPEGTRVGNSSGALMAKLISPNSLPVVYGETNAHHYKFVGIEMTGVGGATATEELLVLTGQHHLTFERCWIHETNNDTATPDSTTTRVVRGCNVNGSDLIFKDCRIAGFRTYKPGQGTVEASNAILFSGVNNQVLVENCYLEAWFVPLFFASGASTPNSATLSSPSFNSGSHTGSATFSNVANLFVGDLVSFKTTGGRTPATNGAHPDEAVAYQVVKVTNIAGNVVSFQSWGSFNGNLAGGNPLLQTPDAPGDARWNGYHNENIQLLHNSIVLNFTSTEAVWTGSGGSSTVLPRASQVSTGNAPKGFIEIKDGKNVLIQGNTFDGWTNGIVLTSRNQSNVLTSGAPCWCGIFDVTIQNNWWKKMANWHRIYGFPIGGPQLEDNEYSNVRSGPVLIHNNLIESGVESFMSSMGAADNVTVTHNTYPGNNEATGGSMIFAQGAASTNFVFRDNILPHNAYGMNCQVAGGGCWPSITQSNNVIMDNRPHDTIVGDGPLTSRYPTDFIAVSGTESSPWAAVGWVDPDNGDFNLDASSQYKGDASDSSDPGVDMVELLAALAGGGEAEAPTVCKFHTVVPCQ